MIKRKGYLNILLGGILASSLLLNTTIYAIDNTNKNDLSNKSVQIDNKEKNNNDSGKENISNNAKVSDTLNEKENSNVSNDSKAVDKIKSGWQEIEGNWYYFNSNGNMKTGWEEINGYWYYFNNDGIMQTGWQELGGTWYYFRTDGNMKVGWEEIDGKWYYFATDGVLETNKVVGDWYINNDGVGNQIVTEGVYGKSGKGRDLEYYRIGHGKKVLFSVFGVHGYEDAWSGDSQELKIIAEKSVNRLRSEYNTKGIDLSEWSVYIIPSANPDGRIDGWTNNGPGRTTVTTKNDINRSFPTGFSPFYSARNYTGPTALGSPEAKALYGFINKTMEGATEKVLLDVHGWENKTIGNPSIARYFDNEFGFRNINKYPGGFVITYGNAIGAKSVLVEFPVPYSHQDILRRDFSGKFANGLVNILLNN